MIVLTGTGFDTHRLVPGRPLIIGGVEIEYEFGLDGHSDADVLAHAITDAVLGAAGLDDIGTHFPDTDERFAGADSIALLRAACLLVAEAGWHAWNVDSTVICERPLLGRYRPRMRARLAEALGLPGERVNVKFTRGEGMGYVGRGEGVVAQAACTLGPVPYVQAAAAASDA